MSPWTQNRTTYTADRLPIRAASSARDRHSPANIRCSSAWSRCVISHRRHGAHRAAAMRA